MTKLSFIHAADLHLDSPFKGLSDLPDEIFSAVKESTFVAFEKLIEEAIQRKVDFILLVGDLFDHERQSLKAQVHLRDGFEKLKEHGIYVYLSYGNHDFLRGNIYPITYPDNVFIFKEENVTSFTYEKDEKKLAKIYGFSYENRAVYENKAAQFELNDETIPFHIASLHGTLHGNKTHDPYAPFQLSDLQSEMFDYWALGHIHERAELSKSPPIIYPGNIQGRHRNETGEKGCYFIELSKHHTNTTFIPLQAIQFESVTVDISPCENMDQLESTLKNALPKTNGPMLVDVTFMTNNRQIHALEADGLLEELIEILNDKSSQRKDWLYIYRYRINVQLVQEEAYNHPFILEMNESFHHLSLRDTLADLYRHPIGRKFVEDVEDEAIITAAKEYLLHQLVKVEEGE